MKNHHQVPVFKKLVDKKVNGKKRKNQLDLDEVLILSVPDDLYKHLIDQPNGTHLGDLFNCKDGKSNSSSKKKKRLRFSVREQLRADTVPDVYDIEIEEKNKQKEKIEKFVFTHVYDNTKARSFEGLVTKSGKMKAVEDEKHVEKVVKRNKMALYESLTKNETLELPEGMSSAAASSIRFGQDIPTRRTKQPEEHMQIAQRISKTKLRDAILAKFEQKEFWKAKDLNKAFRQKDSFFKEVLKEVAEYENSGEHHGCYRIKEQYRLAKFKK